MRGCLPLPTRSFLVSSFLLFVVILFLLLLLPHPSIARWGFFPCVRFLVHQSVSEKHYAAGFENYRTSKSSFLTGQHSSHATVRRTCQVVARLAETRHVEWPQLLRYDPGDWYV